MMGAIVWPESTTMIQRRAKPHDSARALVWLLLVAVALMGLTVTRQQALGSLHLHADQGARGVPSFSATVSNLASDWLSRWRQQQVFGHKQLRFAAIPDAATTWPASDPEADTGSVHSHAHDSLKRHHHAAGDASVVAVDGAAPAADAVDSSAAGAAHLPPLVATPGEGLVLPTPAARRGPWPVDGATAFVSRNISPLLRPPSI
jgi:hypothetical protein